MKKQGLVIVVSKLHSQREDYMGSNLKEGNCYKNLLVTIMPKGRNTLKTEKKNEEEMIYLSLDHSVM